MFDGHGRNNRHLLVRRRPKKLVLHFSQPFPDRSKGLFRCDLQPLKDVNKLLLWLTQSKTPHTCCKLWILTACCKLSTSCTNSVDFIKLQQVCENQTCYNLIFVDLLQVVETTCIKLEDKKS